jgi:hypothetical protein
VSLFRAHYLHADRGQHRRHASCEVTVVLFDLFGQLVELDQVWILPSRSVVTERPAGSGREAGAVNELVGVRNGSGLVSGERAETQPRRSAIERLEVLGAGRRFAVVEFIALAGAVVRRNRKRAWCLSRRGSRS